MIASLRGKLIYKDNTSVVIECSGVGFKCFVTKNTLYNLPQVNDDVFLNTYMVVREDAMDLYGFIDREELDCLFGISGEKKRIDAPTNERFREDSHLSRNQPEHRFAG